MTFLLNKALFTVNDNDTFKENDMINLLSVENHVGNFKRIAF